MPLRRAASSTFAFLRRTPYWSEVWSGVAAITFSLISLLAPGDVTQRPSLLPMGELAGTHFWEAAGLIMGAGQLTAITTNFWPARYAAAFILAAFWTFLALCIAQYDAASPFWGAIACYGASNLVSMVRLVGSRA